MKKTIDIILMGPGGELDRETIRLAAGAELRLSDLPQLLKNDAILAPGDTIRIEERPEGWDQV